MRTLAKKNRAMRESQRSHVIHVRLKKYVAAYCRRIYGEEPFIFPTNHQASLVIENYLIPSDDSMNIPFHCITDRQWRLCQSQSAVRNDGQMLLFEDEFRMKGNTGLVDDWDNLSQSYSTFILPEVVVRRGGEFHPDDGTILSKRGVTMLREVLDREFWIAFMRFVAEQRWLLSERGHTITLEHIMEDFCVMYCIPATQLDILRRAYSREKANLRREVQERRNAVNPDAALFLHEGRPLSQAIARAEEERRQEGESRPVYGEAISNMREFVPQARGI